MLFKFGYSTLPPQTYKQFVSAGDQWLPSRALPSHGRATHRKSWCYKMERVPSKSIRHLRLATLRSTTIKIAKNMLNKNHFCYTNILFPNHLSEIESSISLWPGVSNVGHSPVWKTEKLGYTCCTGSGGLKAMEEFGNSHREWEVLGRWQPICNAPRTGKG